MSTDMDFRDPRMEDGPEADHAFARALAQALGGKVMTGDAPKTSPIHWTFEKGLKFETEQYILPIPDGYAAFKDGDRDFVAMEEQYRAAYANDPNAAPTILYGGNELPLTAPEQYQDPFVRDYVVSLLTQSAMEKQLAMFNNDLHFSGVFEAGKRCVYCAAVNTAGGASYQFSVPGPKSVKMIRVQTQDSPASVVDQERETMLQWLGRMEWKHPHERRRLDDPQLLRDKAKWLEAADGAVADVGIYHKARNQFCMAVHGSDSDDVLFPAMRKELARVQEMLIRAMTEADAAVQKVPGMTAADYDKLVEFFKDMQPLSTTIDSDRVDIPVYPNFHPTLDRWKISADRLRGEERAQREREAEEKRKRQEREAEEQRIREQREAEEKRARLEQLEELALRRREEWKDARDMIGGSGSNFAWVKPDGTVGEIHNSFMSPSIGETDFANVSKFKDIQAVACSNHGIVGLRRDGTCVTTNPGKYCQDQIREANSWTGIQALAAGEHHVVGLRRDGTCVATSIRSSTAYGSYGQSSVMGWSNITAIACGDTFTIGLKKDGTVVYTGDTQYINVGDTVRAWKDVALIAASGKSAAALTRDGKLLCAGSADGEKAKNAEGVVQIAMYGGLVYALQSDGQVIGGSSQGFTMRSRSPIVGKNVVAMTSGLALIMLTEDGKLLTNGTLSRPSELPSDLRLFNSYSALAEERRAKEEARLAEEKQRADYRAANRCQHCGGELKKKLFGWKCLSCGKPKDY